MEMSWNLNTIMVWGWGHWRHGSATGWCHLLAISVEIKVHTKIRCGLMYLHHFLNTFVTFQPHFGPFLTQKHQMWPGHHFSNSSPTWANESSITYIGVSYIYIYGRKLLQKTLVTGCLLTYISGFFQHPVLNSLADAILVLAEVLHVTSSGPDGI